MSRQVVTQDHEDQDLIALLRARGQRVTSQRLVILRELRRRRVHATAEELLETVRDTLPGTSIPTVYATLELFVELGLVRKIDVGIGASLYDARTDSHQHMVCRRCARVSDLDGESDVGAMMDAAAESGFQPESAELVIYGLCAQCAR